MSYALLRLSHTNLHKGSEKINDPSAQGRIIYNELIYSSLVAMCSSSQSDDDASPLARQIHR